MYCLLKDKACEDLSHYHIRNSSNNHRRDGDGGDGGDDDCDDCVWMNCMNCEI